MKKARRSMILLLLLILLMSTCIAVYATSYNFNDTVPLLIQKTLAEGTRASSTNNWTLKLNSTSTSPSMTCWCDATISGTWTLATNNVTVYNNDIVNSYVWGKFIPVQGASARLRIDTSSQNSGKTVVGAVDFK